MRWKVARLKVVDRWPGNRRLLLLFTGSALFMALSIRFRDELSFTRVMTLPIVGPGSYTFHFGEAVLAFVIFPAILVWLSFSEQRVRRAALEALAFAAGTGLVLCGWEFWANRESLGNVVLTAVGIVVQGLAIRLAGLWAVRSMIRQVVFQTGSLCRSCGYDLTGNVSGVCPECGERI